MAKLTINEMAVYDTTETAKRLDMSEPGVRRLIVNGHLLAGRAGRKYMILGRNIVRFLSRNQRAYESAGPEEK